MRSSPRLFSSSAITARGAGRASIALLVLAATVTSACSSVATKPKRVRADAGDYAGLEVPDPNEGRLPDAPVPDYINEDAGIFGPGDRKNGSTSGDAGPGGRTATSDGGDAGPPLNAPDGGPTGPTAPVACTGPLAAGDLAIVEMMIQTAAGAGDRGEWIEVQSTRDCTLNLRGLKVLSPRGDAVDSASVTSDLMLPPDGILVVATSGAAAKANNLPGVVILFAGEPADVLKNDGDTVTLVAGDVTVDTLTYPRFTNFQVGRSISFPVDCAWSERATWARWSYSFYGWSGALKGSPNQDNTDVACY